MSIVEEWERTREVKRHATGYEYSLNPDTSVNALPRTAESKRHFIWVRLKRFVESSGRIDAWFSAGSLVAFDSEAFTARFVDEATARREVSSVLSDFCTKKKLLIRRPAF